MDLSKIENDFQDEDITRVNEFVKSGSPGLERVVKDEAKINSMFSLYMSGKSYTEISQITKVKKNIVLYMSAKLGWYPKRMEYLSDIQNKMSTQLKNTRVESLNFISTLITMHHKYYGDEINKFLETGDKTIIENLDMKQLTQYFKSIEILEKIMNPTNVTKGKVGNTTVNINSSDGSTIKQVDENTIEVTPGETGKLLRAMAKIKEDQKNKDNDEE